MVGNRDTLRQQCHRRAVWDIEPKGTWLCGATRIVLSGRLWRGDPRSIGECYQGRTVPIMLQKTEWFVRGARFPVIDSSSEGWVSKPPGSSQGDDSKNPSFLFSVWFSSSSVHFERHFISFDLAPTRPCFHQPHPYFLSFCPRVEVKSLCKRALNKLMRFWAKSPRIMQWNIFF